MDGGNSPLIKPEVIVTILAEGGSITLLGQKDSNSGWRYSLTTNDHTSTLLDAEEGVGPATVHVSGWVETWKDAVELLDQYPWARLAGRMVHPEFGERIWAEVTRRLGDEGGPQAERARQRWAEACRVESDGGSRNG